MLIFTKDVDRSKKFKFIRFDECLLFLRTDSTYDWTQKIEKGNR